MEWLVVLLASCMIISPLIQAQCPSANITSIYRHSDSDIILPLTVPLCIGCRFLDSQGERIVFNDGNWTHMASQDSMIALTDGSFNGSVRISATDDTSFLFLPYPDTVINLGDTLVCSSEQVGRQNIFTIKAFKFLNPAVLPNGTIDITEGSNLTLNCSDPGNTGTTRYEWINSNGSTIDGPVNSPPLILSLTNIQRMDDRKYICRTTKPGELPGVNMDTAVTINVQYLPDVDIAVSQNNNLTIGGSVIVNCTTTNANPPSVNVTWEKDGLLLDPVNDPHLTVNTQSTYSELTLSPLQEDDTGNYECIANNRVGSKRSSRVTITIQVISTQPVPIVTTATVTTTTVRSPFTNAVSSTASSNSSVLVSVTNVTPTTAARQTDRTIVWIVSGVCCGVLIVAITSLLVIMSCYIYKQSKVARSAIRPWKSYDDGQFSPDNKFKPEGFVNPNSSPRRSVDKIDSQLDTDDMPPPLPPPYHHEEINIGITPPAAGCDAALNSETVVYSKINKKSKKANKSISSSPNKQQPEEMATFHYSPNDEITTASQAPKVVVNSEKFHNRITYEEVKPLPSSNVPNLHTEQEKIGREPANSLLTVLPDTGRVTEQEKIGREPEKSSLTILPDTSHVVYADLNLIRSKQAASARAVEKVVYSDIETIRAKGTPAVRYY